MKPLLPPTGKLIPYLERIDATRNYCNFGPLNDEYQQRLSSHFNSNVITCSSATAGLIASILTLDLPAQSFIACPSWTFPATPAAIVLAGHVPYFVDVDASGKVTDDILSFAITRKIIRAVVIVSPCAAPIVPLSINIPMVIDAAAGFDTVASSRHPTVVSTHATKVFGTGEGGFIICDDKDLLERIRKITNFGFTQDRSILHLGFNAKLSEYHAAVGLAELDGWAHKRERYLERTLRYKLDYATSLVPILRGNGRMGIYGCHIHPAFSHYPRTPLPMTEKLIRQTIFVSVEI